MDQGIAKTYSAEAAVTQYRIVKAGATDGAALMSSASGDKHLGVARGMGVASRAVPHAIGDRFDVARSGFEDVEYGGAVAAGDWLTSDAQGRAVAAAPAGGVNAEVIGKAEVAGVLGDIGKVFLSPCRIQG